MMRRRVGYLMSLTKRKGKKSTKGSKSAGKNHPGHCNN